mmetsp:Transcript_8875/g.12269  ORF Transcript_8875/g.12269 Transcript_8875/m.12269 type:complete len:200 (-) Transcript_8875:156-755(-)|eukprot:CAMPEP_0185733882 /NCGR_PEP_ID=MMETSP1171-20130828/20818_1 /TAXON_ID=374046 /ORGANISM="Helicotheca tamensis, Strain CCMP826" /LENGTH=199 /DNA_ID=CAMNT_0028403731 /DNA_START=106 /DNA_END=705 /DNA_ORIENTATION=+
MKLLTLAAFALAALQAVAFSPLHPSATASRSFTSVRASDDGDAAADPFESYAAGSSLAFKELSPGSGEPSADGDVLTVAYGGKLFEGRQFDSSEGWKFKMGGGNVMPGFDEGLKGAKEGSKRIVRIPPELAYGATGKRGIIPPNSDLEFTIEVKEITRGIAGDIKLFGEERLIGLIACVALMGAAPFLPPIPAIPGFGN